MSKPKRLTWNSNVDRIIALWQAIYPDSWVRPLPTQDRTFMTRAGTVENSNTRESSLSQVEMSCTLTTFTMQLSTHSTQRVARSGPPTPLGRLELSATPTQRSKTGTSARTSSGGTFVQRSMRSTTMDVQWTSGPSTDTPQASMGTEISQLPESISISALS